MKPYLASLVSGYAVPAPPPQLAPDTDYQAGGGVYKMAKRPMCQALGMLVHQYPSLCNHPQWGTGTPAAVGMKFASLQQLC